MRAADGVAMIGVSRSHPLRRLFAELVRRRFQRDYLHRLQQLAAPEP
ncbi:MAG: hypothetical protein ACE5MH_07070 [Terriglobia bacterium]